MLEPTDSAFHTSESFTTNGLKPFTTLEDAKNAQQELSIQPFAGKTSLLHIQMDIAQNQADLDSLKRRRRLVVIETLPDFPDDKEIYGSFTEDPCEAGIFQDPS